MRFFFFGGSSSWERASLPWLRAGRFAVFFVFLGFFVFSFFLGRPGPAGRFAVFFGLAAAAWRSSTARGS